MVFDQVREHRENEHESYGKIMTTVFGNVKLTENYFVIICRLLGDSTDIVDRLGEE